MILRLLLILCMVASVLLGIYIVSFDFFFSVSAENVIRLHLFILLIKWSQDFDALNMASSQAFIVLNKMCTQCLLTRVHFCSICMQLLLATVAAARRVIFWDLCACVGVCQVCVSLST